MLLQHQQEEEATYRVASIAADPAPQEQPSEIETPTADIAVQQHQASMKSPTGIRLVDPASEAAESWLDYVALKPVQRWNLSTALIAVGVTLPYWRLLAMLTENYDGEHFAEHFSTPYNTLTMLFGSVVPLVLLARINQLRRESELTRYESALPETPNVAWLPRLTEALRSPQRSVRQAAEHLLPRLLVRMRARDETLLTPDQWEILGMRLRANRPRDTVLNLAILKMLGHMGGEAMLAYVEAAAVAPVWTPRTWLVRRAAREYLITADIRLQVAEVAARESGAVQGELAIAGEQTSQEARAISPELAALLKELDAQRRGHAQPAMRIAFLLAAYAVILPTSLWQAGFYFDAHAWGAAALWASLAAITTQLYRFSLFPQHSELMQKLAAYHDVAGVGALAETLEWPDKKVHDMAANALKRLLPKLRASDARLLTKSQRACLYRMLTMAHVGRDGALILAILKALQQVGDEAAIPHVQRLARSVALTPTQRRVRQAAEDSLPFLRTSADQQRASQTLLRASAQDNVVPEGLLRPAYSVSTTDPQELLRAGTAAEG